MNSRYLLAAAFVSLVASATASATPIQVKATDDIFAAGLTTVPSSTGGGGTLPTGIAASGGEVFTVSAAGLVQPGNAYGTNGPAGFSGVSDITNSTGSAVGNYYNGSNSFELVGVFLVPGAATDPIFNIGTGGMFKAPTGATMLYFGLADGFAFGATGPVGSGYYSDNTGSFAVTVTGATPGVPEPATWASMIAGLGMVGIATRRRRMVQAV